MWIWLWRASVGGYEVYLGGGVGEFVVGYVALVGASAFVFGAFDLDAKEAAVVLDGEVVAGHVSPGLGDAESVLGGAGHETQFGPLAPELGVLDIDSLIGHDLPGNGFRESRRPRTGVSALHELRTNEKRGLLGPRLVSYSNIF
jgi:hypothetical protein